MALRAASENITFQIPVDKKLIPVSNPRTQGALKGQCDQMRIPKIMVSMPLKSSDLQLDAGRNWKASITSNTPSTKSEIPITKVREITPPIMLLRSERPTII